MTRREELQRRKFKLVWCDRCRRSHRFFCKPRTAKRSGQRMRHALHRAMYELLTGWRFASEVLALQWRNVDFEAGTIRLDMGSTKNKEGRLVYMTAQLRTVLEEQRQKTLVVQRTSGQIIPCVFHRDGQPMTKYDRVWGQACQAAGLPGKILHDFRRTAVRNMVRAGIPERVAMQMAGHKTRSVFDRYHIVSDSDLQDAARRLERACAGQTMTKTMTVARLTSVETAVSA